MKNYKSLSHRSFSMELLKHIEMDKYCQMSPFCLPYIPYITVHIRKKDVIIEEKQ